MTYYVIKGGLGKHIAFTSLIDKLAGQEEIGLVSAYPEVFTSHPKVAASWNFNEPGMYDRIPRDAEIIYREPYLSPFVFARSHLLHEWGKMLGIEYQGELPQIYLNEDGLTNAALIQQQLPEKYLFIQFSGGQSPYNANMPHMHRPQGQRKEYPLNMAQQFINEFTQRHPDISIINYALANEEYRHLQGCLTLDIGYLLYAELLKNSLGFVGIDSSLQHMAAGVNVPGVVIWGATGPEQFGYALHNNLSNTVNHHMRPLCEPFGDQLNADGSLWADTDILSTAVPVEKVLQAAETLAAQPQAV